jgi:CheY-like chemotaxis protein/nitrogen-specific signal transduction histidine kinase
MRKKRAKPAEKRQVVKRRARPDGSRAQATELALASLAHEVRTPLNGILALSELLAASALPERERSWAAAVKSAAEHLNQLTTAVVDGVKAEEHKLIVRREPFHLRRLADAVAAALRARAEAKDLHAVVTIAEDLPVGVIGDALRLRAALENLIDNAVKFTESGEVALDISARPGPRGHVRLTFAVQDSGIGLSAVEIKRLLRPFAQASTSVARRFGGAGLGLVFVRRIAKAMGGNLTIESAPRRGCRFRLEVNVKSQSRGASDESAGPERARTAAPRSLRVLCAEDNPYGRVVLNTILTELGHRPDFVGTGEAAVDAVGRIAYDVVLMDINLPGIDGMAATRLIRNQSENGAQLPIFGISGQSERDGEAAVRAVGMTGYLMKPVSPAALASLLNGVAAA